MTRDGGHRIEIVSKFFVDGWTAECSCGWRSEEMATQDAALGKSRVHLGASSLCKCGHALADHTEYDDVPCEGSRFAAPGSFLSCECNGFEATEGMKS